MKLGYLKTSAILFAISAGIGFFSHPAHADDQPDAPSAQEVSRCEKQKVEIDLRDVGLGDGKLVIEDAGKAWEGMKEGGQAVGEGLDKAYHHVADPIAEQIKIAAAKYDGYDLRVIVVGAGKGAYLIGKKDGKVILIAFGKAGKATLVGLEKAGKYVAQPYKDSHKKYGHETLIAVGETAGIGTYELGKKSGIKVWHGLRHVGGFFAKLGHGIKHHFQDPVDKEAKERTMNECLYPDSNDEQNDADFVPEQRTTSQQQLEAAPDRAISDQEIKQQLNPGFGCWDEVQSNSLNFFRAL